MMWCGRHCREDEESKVEMVWTCNKKRLRSELVKDILE